MRCSTSIHSSANCDIRPWAGLLLAGAARINSSTISSIGSGAKLLGRKVAGKMISQFFILSPRGDVIIRRDYLGNVPKASTEVFFRSSKFWKDGEEAPPIFLVDGVTYLHVKEGGVELVATTRDNISPSFVLEFLRRICTIIKDYCGFLSEDVVRKNFTLIYELLDEVIDYGLPQSTSTEYLKQFVLNEPTLIPQQTLQKPLFGITKGPTGVFKSVLETTRTDGKRKDEIFVDVVERLNCTFSASGYLASASIDGAVQVKSYLAGYPAIKIKLNDDLMIGKRDAPYGTYSETVDSNTVVLDDCNFHESADLKNFDLDRTITLVPPDGEFALMNYRTSHCAKPPFRVYSSLEQDPNSDMKALLTVRLWCEVAADKSASGLELEVPMPKAVRGVHADLDPASTATQSYEFLDKSHMLKWRFKKVGGGQEATLRARLKLDRLYTATLKGELGPINLKFTIPMYAASRLQLKYLQILKRDKNFNPYRWVRYVTSSSSYIFRN